MEPKFQTSFIPKKPLGAASGSSVKLVRETNAMSLIASTLFVIAILLSGALFGYEYLLKRQIAEADQNINSARETFELDRIQALIDSNARIMAAEELLESHIAVSGMLGLLEELTVKRIQLTEFVYKNQGRMPAVTLQGLSQNYNALAEQGRIFKENDFIQNESFYNFEPTENGFIKVNFSSNIDPTLVSYKKALNSLSSNQ